MAACGDLFSNNIEEESGSNGIDNDSNTRYNAIPVTAGYSSSHTISSGSTHWFKFAGTGETVIFETTGNAVDTYISVFSGNSNLAYSNDNGGDGNNALFTQSTTSGITYYIRIEARNSTSGDYTFVVTTPTTNERINPIYVSTGYSSQHVISSSGQHWFSFQGTGGSVIVQATSNVVSTKNELFIGQSTSAILSDNTRISVSTVLGTTYYIKITGNSGTYTFSFQSGSGDGTSRTYAIPVTVGYSSFHTISQSGTHWFSFLGTGETVIFETTGSVVDTYISVFIGNSYLGFSNDNGGDGYNAKYSQNTTVGEIYFIHIETRKNTYGNYFFVVKKES
jgi:hypothetical protein